MLSDNCSVLIVGGGPCGLMFANELGRRGVDTILVDEKPTTAFNPQANATQARTMEYFRRRGFASEIRELGLPPSFPTDIAYFTRYAKHELARFKLPSSREARSKVGGPSQFWNAAELPHRVSQNFVEATLRKKAEELPGISINYGWKFVSFRDQDTHVRAVLECASDGNRREIESQYLIGANGPRSMVRSRLGFRYQGESGVVRDFMGGQMYAFICAHPTSTKPFLTHPLG